MNEAERIAAALTKAEREAATIFTGEWTAGPTLSDEALAEIEGLQEASLLERRFLDEGPPIHSVGEHHMSVKLSACWHFRLTPLGLSVRRILSETPHAE